MSPFDIHRLEGQQIVPYLDKLGKTFQSMSASSYHRSQLLSLFNGLGSRDGAVVRALASHQCGPGSTPGPGVICGCCVVVSRPCSERFFSGYSGFPLSPKPTFLNSNSIWTQWTKSLFVDVPLTKK